MYSPDLHLNDFISAMFEVGHDENDEKIEYEGNIHIDLKTSDGKFKLVGSFPAKTAAERIPKLALRQNCDYYITANRLKNHVRRSTNVFGLSNIVIDIDCHNYLFSLNQDVKEENKKRAKERDGLIVDLVRNMMDGLFGQEDYPKPNAIVYTGRGLQLWFSLEPCSASLKKIYKKTVHYLCEMITKFIRKFKRYKDFNVDEAASINPAGLFRLPGSRNTKARIKGNYELIHDKKTDLIIFFNRCVLGFDWNRQPSCSNNKYASAMALNRENMMINYLTYDGGRHASEEGHRDHVCFIVYNAWLTASNDKDLAWKRTVNINNRFNTPLPEFELRNYMRTSSRVGGYKLTNDWIISTLDLDVDEMQYIGISETKLKKKGQKKRPVYDKKTHNLIIKLVKQGKNKKEIAEEAGCSQATVGRYLKAKGILTEKEKRHNQIAFYLFKGHTVKEVMKLTGAKRSTINYIKEKLHFAANRINATDDSLVFSRIRKKRKIKKARKFIELRVNEMPVKKKRRKKPVEEVLDNANRQKYEPDFKNLIDTINREVFHEKIPA